MLDYAEKIIAHQHSEIIIDASLPAKGIYHKRGDTKEIEFKPSPHIIMIFMLRHYGKANVSTSFREVGGVDIEWRDAM